MFRWSSAHMVYVNRKRFGSAFGSVVISVRMVHLTWFVGSRLGSLPAANDTSKAHHHCWLIGLDRSKTGARLSVGCALGTLGSFCCHNHWMWICILHEPVPTEQTRRELASVWARPWLDDSRHGQGQCECHTTEVDSIPLTKSGKKDRAAIRRLSSDVNQDSFFS